MTGTVTRRPLADRLRWWTLSPDRRWLVSEHADPDELICRPLAADASLPPAGSATTLAMPGPDWQLLGWATTRQLALWRPARRPLLTVLDVTGGEQPVGPRELVGRPIQCRLTTSGELAVLVAMAGGGQPELWLYRSELDGYQRVPASTGSYGVSAWDAQRSIFAANLPGTVRLYGYDREGCRELPVAWPEPVWPIAATDCAAGRITLTGRAASGQSVPGLLDLDRGAVSWFEDQAGWASLELSPSGDRQLVSCWRGQLPGYRVLDAAGQPVSTVEPADGLLTEFRLARDEQHLIGVHQSPAAPPRLARWAPPDPRPWPLEPTKRPAGEPALRWLHRWVPDQGGRELPEWVFQPATGESVGTVLFLHGGPRGRLKPEYDPAIDALVRGGWTVVGSNYPGSAGYGADYRELGRGDWGGVDAEALERRLATLQATGRPVCLYGQSYGGYLALLLAARRPELVASTAVWAPVTDLPELAAGLSGVRHRWLADELGELLHDPDRLWQRSPASRAGVLAGCRLLIGHGARDDRCPVEQSRRLAELVRRRGGDIRYLEGDGGHAPTDPAGWAQAVTEHFTAAVRPDRVPLAGALR